MTVEETKIWNGEYLGIKTIEFSCGGYEGAFTIEGANLIKLDYIPKNVSLMHIASDETELRTNKIYGIPLLFFPNRIKDGTFSFEGRRYNFPINAENNVHLHGFLDGYTPWEVIKSETDGDTVHIVFAYRICKGSEMYKYFDFDIEIIYENTITPGGLEQKISFTNKSGRNMPFGFAYHTTFNIPFNNSPEEAFFIRANLRQEYELDKCIPTGKLLTLDASGQMAAKDGLRINADKLDNLYLADDSKPNIAVITDICTGVQAVYEADSHFKHWILYNADTKQNFLSVEPQTCCTNAVNSDMKTANLITVGPDKTISLNTKLYIK